MHEGRTPRLWVELDDLLRYFDASATPTGIGRVQLEVIPQLLAAYPGRVGLCRIGTSPDDVRVLQQQTLASLADPEFLQSSQGHNVVQMRIRETVRLLSRRLHGLLGGHSSPDSTAFRDTVERGDVLVALGGGWTHVNFGPSLRALKQRHGLRFALLIHDILPITHPAFVASGFRPPFQSWFDEMRRTWDAVLTPSDSVAGDVRAHLQAIGAPVPPITTIPFGFGFDGDNTVPASTTPITGGPYVLFVSTLEVRKNHVLLYRVWDRLIRKHGRDRVPKLVFAGSRGWGVKELRRLLRASNNLGGKIQLVSNLSDAQMARAYADCRFTLFPSFCEGWGLPVSESLFHGKLCIASNATSIPEIGGAAVDYFDPHDEDEAFTQIERALFEPGYLERREIWIAENFRLPTWDDTARAIFEALLGPPTQAGVAEESGAGATRPEFKVANDVTTRLERR